MSEFSQDAKNLRAMMSSPERLGQSLAAFTGTNVFVRVELVQPEDEPKELDTSE